MNELNEVIEAATAAIEEKYFQLSIYGSTPIYRERVYTYELYHQMRRVWPNECAFTLNGEVDKRAHAVMEELGFTGQKPDLLVHKPGDWTGNFAVLEIKHVPGALKDPVKDLETLSLFRSKADYKRSLYLIYGSEADDKLVDRITKAANDVDNVGGTELWLHTEVGRPAFLATTL